MAAKILLVEDDNNLREIYEARLQAEGYAIVTAKDGEEALSVAKTELPDLVVSDVMMPRVSGFEMLDILRNTEALKNTKVIMLTALGQADDKTRASSLGADRYLVKSQVTLEDIVKAAHELLEGVAPASDAAAPAGAPASAPPMPPVDTPPAAVPAPDPAAPATPVAPVDPPMPPATPPAPADPAMPVAPAPEPVAPPMAPEPAAMPDPVVPAPPQPTPDPTTASPAFSSLIGAVPAAPEPAAAPPAPDTATAAPTTSEEQATVGAQIDNFVNDPNAGGVTPPTMSVTAQDDAVLTNAVNDLAASSGQSIPVTTDAAPAVPAPEQPTPAPSAPGSDSVVIANKKVIQPLNSTTKANINDLLAQEQAQAGNAGPANPLAGMSSFDPNSVNMADHPDPALPTPNTVFGPSQAPAAPAAPAEPLPMDPSAPVAPPQPPKPTDFDPNNISL